MNLIEQLGGYKNSKGIREAYVNNGWSVSDVCKGFHEYFTIEDLDCALLEYRRQNNIFEEGDWVVIPSRGNGIFQVSRLLSRTDVKEMEHATDAEIEAGRRL